MYIDIIIGERIARKQDGQDGPGPIQVPKKYNP